MSMKLIPRFQARPGDDACVAAHVRGLARQDHVPEVHGRRADELIDATFGLFGIAPRLPPKKNRRPEGCQKIPCVM